MNLNHLTGSLKKLRDLGAVGLKAEFEAEGLSLSEMEIHSELSQSVSLPLTIKIGGCEAISDLIVCQSLGCSKVVAPMIESRFALEKYLSAIEVVYSKTNRPEIYFNLETSLGLSRLNSILTPPLLNLDGIVLGRKDFVLSQSSPEISPDSELVADALIKIGDLCKNRNLGWGVGGSISHNSLPWLHPFVDLGLDFFETRKIIFDSSILQTPLAAENLLSAAIQWEIDWLKFKVSSGTSLENRDIARVKMLELRLFSMSN